MTCASRATATAIREIHVVSSSQRPAKQIVRDIQSVLLARFNRSIDHRVVSVAFTASRALRGRAGLAHTRPPHRAAGRPPPIAIHELPPAETAEDRVRFGSVNLYHRRTARTGAGRTALARRDASRHRLRLEFARRRVPPGRDARRSRRCRRSSRTTSASGSRTSSSFASAARRSWWWGWCCWRTGRKNCWSAVARWSRMLSRRWHLRRSRALNRVMGGLRTREATEYVLRPSSAREASGAKRE